MNHQRTGPNWLLIIPGGAFFIFSAVLGIAVALDDEDRHTVIIGGLAIAGAAVAIISLILGALLALIIYRRWMEARPTPPVLDPPYRILPYHEPRPPALAPPVEEGSFRSAGRYDLAAGGEEEIAEGAWSHSPARTWEIQ